MKGRDAMIGLDTIHNEDCLQGMKRIPDGCVDMVLCDLPYGITNASWDSKIDLAALWVEYDRVCKKKRGDCFIRCG
jgi:site-specific DNA-methyltransferase (adenine-specific)